MLVSFSSGRWSAAAVVSWRVVWHRFSFAALMGLAAILLIWGHIQPAEINGARMRAVDALVPVLNIVTRPVAVADQIASGLHDYLALRADNLRLRQENTELREWRESALKLTKENSALQSLLNFKTEPGRTYISARVIADTGGAFTRGLVVTAGQLDGVREGMAAMTGDGLIGRVVEVGEWSSRVMLITDLNTRIPVMVQDTGDRAILAGDNSAYPRLMYLPQDATPRTGARVVTSGHGGIFPPNLPVGVVVEGSRRDVYTVIPAADSGHVDYVRLVDFSLKGGTFNPVATRVESEARGKKH